MPNPLFEATPLLTQYQGRKITDEKQRRAPWAWGTLNPEERIELTARVWEFVQEYNQVYAVVVDDLIPPCWAEHPGLAMELSSLTWLWFSANIDPTAAPERIGDFYHRWLPGFKQRLDSWLGSSPSECRDGDHPASWRRDVEKKIAGWPESIRNATDLEENVTAISEHAFGFIETLSSPAVASHSR